MTDAQRSMEADLASLGVIGSPLFVIRRARCGCRLGAVHKTKLAGYVVAGRRSGAMVETKGAGVRRWQAWYVQSLEEPSSLEPWGCRHADGLLPTDDLLERARDTRTNGPFVIE